MNKIVGISYSYAHNSLQTRGLTLLSKTIPMSVYDMLDFDMPMCNSNKSDGVVPFSVDKFNSVLEEADILVFAISEATSHYNSGFKNAMDWLVVKSKFNARLGTDYTITDKPIFVITFTPTVRNESMNGARHFDMTRHLLEKLGSNVVDMFVIHDCWRTIVPGNESHLTELSKSIKIFDSNYQSSTLSKYKINDDTSSPRWLELYNEWDNKWKV
jgi:NAD(P)H-dependent FMN reductase